MKDWIRNWLGINDLKQQLEVIETSSINTSTLIRSIDLTLRATSSGLGRIIAKLDPMYAKPEDDKDRKTESDNLGNDVIKRIKAEDQARRHTTGDL